MPPKKLITTEQIIEMAFQIIQREGYASLTARKLAMELNCSTQPLYQAFSDMNGLKAELMIKAQDRMMNYILENSDKNLPAELAYVLTYIRFAFDERYLFQFIFTSGSINHSELKERVSSDVVINLDLMIYANGIIMMLAFHTLPLTEEMVRGMVINVYHKLKDEGRAEKDGKN